MNTTKYWKEDILTEKILTILAHQQIITNQGRDYVGEKDWALNEIKSLISQTLQQRDSEWREKIEGMKKKTPYPKEAFNKLAEEGETVTLNSETVPKAIANFKMMSANMEGMEHRAGYNQALSDLLHIMELEG